MPIVTLYLNQFLRITADITVTLVKISGDEAYLKIDSPAGVLIIPFNRFGTPHPARQKLAS